MIEMLLKDDEEKIPADWKFDVINGRVATVYLVHDRFGNPTEALYDRDFKRLWACTSHEDSPEIERPSIFGEMVAIAEDLAFEMDQISVDLYNVDGKIYFGEFTLYPASGLNRFEPVSFDFALGEKWNLDTRFKREFNPWYTIQRR